jgi:hypothetical protein
MAWRVAGAHGREAEPLGELSQDALRRLPGLDDPRVMPSAQAEAETRKASDLDLVAGEIALAQLVLDELVGGGGIRHPQQGLGQHHEGQALLGGERVFPQHLLHAPEAPALGAIASMRRRGAIDARLALRERGARSRAPAMRVVLGVGREGGRGAGGMAGPRLR